MRLRLSKILARVLFGLLLEATVAILMLVRAVRFVLSLLLVKERYEERAVVLALLLSSKCVVPLVKFKERSYPHWNY